VVSFSNKFRQSQGDLLPLYPLSVGYELDLTLSAGFPAYLAGL
jgi:hypothetical protein